MSYASEAYAQDLFVADASLDERVTFIRRVYAHVGGATLLFAGLVALFVNSSTIAESLAVFGFQHHWIMLIGFFIATQVAHSMAEHGASMGVQYAGLGLYALAEAVFFTPILWLLHTHMAGGDHIIIQAGMITLIIFGGLTLFVLVTRSDFSFLKNILAVLMLAAFALMIASFFGGLSLGTWFVMGMIVLMCGFILYETSNVLHHYHTSQYVSAALAVFASLATLFWYVLQLLSFFGDD